MEYWSMHDISILTWHSSSHKSYYPSFRSLRIFSLLYVNISPAFTTLPNSIANSESKSAQAVNLVCATSGHFQIYPLWRWKWCIHLEMCQCVLSIPCMGLFLEKAVSKLLLCSLKFLAFANENFSPRVSLPPYPSCSGFIFCTLQKHNILL